MGKICTLIPQMQGLSLQHNRLSSVVVCSFHVVSLHVLGSIPNGADTKL